MPEVARADPTSIWTLEVWPPPAAHGARPLAGAGPLPAALTRIVAH